MSHSPIAAPEPPQQVDPAHGFFGDSGAMFFVGEAPIEGGSENLEGLSFCDAVSQEVDSVSFISLVEANKLRLGWVDFDAPLVLPWLEHTKRELESSHGCPLLD